MYHVFEVNGSAVVLKSTEEALQVIHGNPDRVIAEDQTKKWETWAMTMLVGTHDMDRCMIDGRFDPDAARVVLSSRLLPEGENIG